MESWFPSTIELHPKVFEPWKNNTTKVETLLSNGIQLTLLANGKLVASLRSQSGYSQTTPQRYNCD